MLRVPRRFVVLALLLALVIAAAPLFVPLPAPILRPLTIASATLLLDDTAQHGFVAAAARRLLSTYIQMSLATRVAERATAGAQNDVEALAGIARTVAATTVTASASLDAPHYGPVLLFGRGFCDQINSGVAMVAARRFGRVELFAMYDPKTHESPHTVGRVWSRERNEWLYFDAFYSPVIYDRTADGKARVLAAGGGPRYIGRYTPPLRFYDFSGWPTAPFHRTFVAQVVARAGQQRIVPSGLSDERQMTTAASSAAPKGLIPSAIPGVTLDTSSDKAFRHVARRFMAVRFDEIVTGKTDPAAYRAIAADAEAAADGRAAELAEIARQLAERTSAPASNAE
ncbi:MAG TPA: hypothetical protein VF824_22625 [Thermoanaerobaculia bacterium]|jgi:hypothetical protein